MAKVKAYIKTHKKWVALAIVILTTLVDWASDSIGIIEALKAVFAAVSG